MTVKSSQFISIHFGLSIKTFVSTIIISVLKFWMTCSASEILKDKNRKRNQSLAVLDIEKINDLTARSNSFLKDLHKRLKAELDRKNEIFY